MKVKLFFIYLFLYVNTLTAGPFNVDQNIRSGDFDDEIEPFIEGAADNTDIRNISGKIEYISNSSWVVYRDFNFGVGATYFSIEAASLDGGGRIILREGALDGSIIGSVEVEATGDWQNYKEYSIFTKHTLSGVKDLYLVFEGNSGYLFNTRNLIFKTIGPDLKQFGSELGFDHFDGESHPEGLPITQTSNGIESIFNDSWVCFENFNFGEGANYITVNAASARAGGLIEVRIGSLDGKIVGKIETAYTGDDFRYYEYSTVFNEALSGGHDLYFKFIDSYGIDGVLFNLKNFLITRQASNSLPLFINDRDGDRVHPLMEYALGMNNESRDTVPLVLHPEKGGIGYDIEVRLRANRKVQTYVRVSSDLRLWQTVALSFRDGVWDTDNDEISISEVTKIDDEIYRVKLTDQKLNQMLFVQLVVDLPEGDLNVYSAVPELDPSEHYSFEVQKVSVLNDSESSATNWLKPFAWITRCKFKDTVNDDGTKNTAYYSSYIGGWTHTYCNIEVDINTPIVVKISRLNEDGVSEQNIHCANVHPAQKVESCEVINGDVYVTLRNPCLIAVDIDGQMDRDCPHGEAGDEVHAVTIFANPFIENKPEIGGEGVLTVSPGDWNSQDLNDAIAADDWSTLYFLSGVHKMSTDNGIEREWTIHDPHVMKSGKSYYIPGDAIVYGNFNDYGNSERDENIRVFGHGTLSGEKIPHWQDPSGGEMKSDRRRLRMLELTNARGCTFEGVTIANPAEHGVYIWGDEADYTPNYMKWLKNISWRVNNDGGYCTGNGYVEDCFFRHQDDALYVRGMAVRRCVFWSDVNGIPFRCSFVSHDRGGNYPSSLPQSLIVEDCDVIYARGVFGGPDARDYAIFASEGGAESKTYNDGVANTGQHLIFRDIRITDPHPARYLFGFSVENFNQTGNAFEAYKGHWAGIQFENITFKHPHPLGWRNRFLGTSESIINHWRFENVTIGGVLLDSDVFNNPLEFETEFVEDMIFK